jgi:hypothetical protein
LLSEKHPKIVESMRWQKRNESLPREKSKSTRTLFSNIVTNLMTTRLVINNVDYSWVFFINPSRFTSQKLKWTLDFLSLSQSFRVSLGYSFHSCIFKLFPEHINVKLGFTRRVKDYGISHSFFFIEFHWTVECALCCFVR